MSVIKVKMQKIDVDIRAELEQFNWTRPRWSSDRLIAASPFRHDHTPSFFVSLEGEYAGCFGDSGAYDAEWASGNFVKLLAFLRNETYEESEDYLLASYGIPDDGTGAIKLRPIKLNVQRSRQPLNAAIIAKFSEDFTYLQSRGISANVQRQMGVRYDPASRAAVIPWYLPDGRLANVKYRKTRGKIFWYAKQAWPIRELVYGIDQAQATTVICEAEIDAMSWQEAGYAAIAVGGASFNGWKRDAILRSPIETLVIATDNDKAGEKLRREIASSLSGKVRVRQAYLEDNVKDANEALVKYGVNALTDAVEKSEGCPLLYTVRCTTGRGKR